MYKVKLATEQERKSMNNYIKSVDEAFYSLASKDPQGIIDYATFQLYTGNYQKGSDLLLSLENKFKTHSNHGIKKQIYTILGHLTHRLDDPEKTLVYLQLAYHNAHQDIGIHYRLMSSYNVARALHFLGRNEDALVKFEEVIKRASIINEMSYQSLANLRIAQISLNKNDLESAEAALAGITKKHLLSYDLALYEQLKQRIKAPN